MIDSHNDWWAGVCERADRITARQLGAKPAHPIKILSVRDAPIELVREAIAKMLAPSAGSRPPLHRSASVRTRMMLTAANQRRAELGQPLISFD